MKIGSIGLEAAGQCIIRKLLERDHEVVARDIDGACAFDEVTVAGSIEELVGSLQGPRLIMIHLPNRSVKPYIEQLHQLLEPGDTIIDLSDSLRRNSRDRHDMLRKSAIGFLDVGLGGGLQSEEHGFACFVGGDEEVYTMYRPVIEAFAAPDGIIFHPQPGSGHFAKMVHCGIEYGMIQAIAEGFTLLHNDDHYDLDLEKLAALYGRSSTIASRLVANVAEGYSEFGPDLEQLHGKVISSKQGERIIHHAHEMHLPLPVIEEAVEQRKQSALKPTYMSKLVSLLRHTIGKRNALRQHQSKKQ